MSYNLRYIEISRRNQVSRIFVGTGATCSKNSIRCGDICIDIVRAGAYNCSAPIQYNACCQPQPEPLCDPIAAHVCAVEIDEEGYAVFEWPLELLDLKEGWYEGHIVSNCNKCGTIPVRIGPRCNVIKVEEIVNGPDSLCVVGCDDNCADNICGPKPSTASDKKVYVPTYKVY